MSIATPTDDPAGGDEPFLVNALDPDQFTDSAKFPGFSLNRSVLSTGYSDAISMYVGEVAPGAGGPGTHIHAFDQFYFVLSGELSVEVGLERYTAAPGSLVCMPAGVPHRQWNEASETERHVALLVPTPKPGKPLDIAFHHEPTGEVID